MNKPSSSSQGSKVRKYSWTSSILFIIVLLQWLLISYLLLYSQSEYLPNHSKQLVVTSNSISLVDDPTKEQELTHKNNNNDVYENSDSEKDVVTSNNASLKGEYEGVAAILMLNSPKWYQRRYTSTIANALMNTPPSWAVQIFYIGTGQSQAGLGYNPGIGRLQQTYPDRLVLTQLPSELVQKFGMRKRLLYWTNAWMWEHMLSDRVFVINGGGIICANSPISLLDGTTAISLFDQLDYLGSPWPKFQKRGGEGSISFRNRNAMLDVIQFQPHDGKMTEDYYFVSNLLKMNKEIHGGKEHYRLANEHQMQTFGGISNNFTESMGPPMIISGTLSNLDHSIRDTVINLCPELKLIFPVLHNPNCFGAHPNSDKCAQSICALRDPKQRTSGC